MTLVSARRRAQPVVQLAARQVAMPERAHPERAVAQAAVPRADWGVAR
jgi:hypothetical protein